MNLTGNRLQPIRSISRENATGKDAILLPLGKNEENNITSTRVSQVRSHCPVAIAIQFWYCTAGTRYRRDGDAWRWPCDNRLDAWWREREPTEVTDAVAGRRDHNSKVGFLHSVYCLRTSYCVYCSQGRQRRDGSFRSHSRSVRHRATCATDYKRRESFLSQGLSHSAYNRKKRIFRFFYQTAT